MEAILILFCIIFIGIAYFVKSEGGSFFLGRRDSGAISLALSMSATWVGAASLLALSGWAATFGGSAIWYLLCPGIGLMLLSVFGVDSIREKKGLMIADYHDNKYFQASISIFLLVLYILILSAQFTGFAKISGLFDLNYIFGLILSACIVSIYVAIGGFDAVKNTDIVQVVLIFLSVVLIVMFMPYDIEFPQSSSIFSLDGGLPNSLFMLFVSAGFMMFVAQENHQRIKAAKHAKDAKQACFIAGIILIAFSFLIVSIGLSVPEQVKDPISHIIAEVDSSILSFFIAIGIMAATLSTADSALNIASYSAFNIVKSSRMNVVYIFVCSVLALIAAYLIASVGEIILICINLCIGVLLPVIISTFLNKSSTVLMCVLLSSGAAVGVGYGLSWDAPGLVGLCVGAVFSFFSSAFRGRASEI